MRIALPLILILSVFSVLAACRSGGGGGSQDTSSPPETTPPTDATAPTIVLDYTTIEPSDNALVADIELTITLSEDIPDLYEGILSLSYLEVLSFVQTSVREIKVLLRPMISEGEVGIQISANEFNDAAGNGNEASPFLSFPVTQIMPAKPSLADTDRGFNFGWWDDTDASDAEAIKAVGGNLVRLVFRWYREEGKNHDSYDANVLAAQGYISPSYLSILDEQVKWLDEQGIKIIFTVEAGGGSVREDNFWKNDSEILARYKAMWAFLIERYRDTESIVAWELLSEPHPNKLYGSNFAHSEVRDFYADLIHSLKDAANQNRPFIVGPQFYYKPQYLTDDFVITDNDIKERVIYTFNLLADTRSGESYDYQYLSEQVNLALSFKNKHGVRIYCNQVGAELELADSATIRSNMISILNSNTIPWTYWNWRGGVFEVRKLDGSYNQEVYDFFLNTFLSSEE